MADRKRKTIPEVKAEQLEASETLTQGTEMDYDFLPQEEAAPKETAVVQEEITVGQTKVIFREPTEEQLPTDIVARADTGLIGRDFFDERGEWTATVIGESPTGSKLQVLKRKEGTGYHLGWKGAGSLPAHLTGWYTTFEKAEVAGRIYLHSMWDEARKAG